MSHFNVTICSSTNAVDTYQPVSFPHARRALASCALRSRWRRPICRALRHQHLSAGNIFVYQLRRQLLSFCSSVLTPSISLTLYLSFCQPSLVTIQPVSAPNPPFLWNSLSKPTEHVCQLLSTLICPSLSACASACIYMCVCVCRFNTVCSLQHVVRFYT